MRRGRRRRCWRAAGGGRPSKGSWGRAGGRVAAVTEWSRGGGRLPRDEAVEREHFEQVADDVRAARQADHIRRGQKEAAVVEVLGTQVRLIVERRVVSSRRV